MKFPDDFEIGEKALDEVENHAITSRSQLAKRTRQNEDKLGRLLQELEVHFGSVITFESHRLKVTDAGRAVKRQFGELRALANGREIPAEMLTIEAEPWLCEALLPRVLRGFLDLWGSVQLRVRPLTDGVRRNIQEGSTSLGLALATDEEGTISAKEVLGPRLPWVLVSMPESHDDCRNVSTAAQCVGPGSNVFVPSTLASHSSVSAFMAASPQFSVIACDAALAMARSGAGPALVPDVLGTDSGLHKTEVRGATPVRLRVFLPRQAAAVSEAAQSLLELLHQMVEPKPATEPAKGEIQADIEANGNGPVGALPQQQLAEQETNS